MDTPLDSEFAHGIMSLISVDAMIVYMKRLLTHLLVNLQLGKNSQRLNFSVIKHSLIGNSTA